MDKRVVSAIFWVVAFAVFGVGWRFGLLRAGSCWWQNCLFCAVWGAAVLAVAAWLLGFRDAVAVVVFAQLGAVGGTVSGLVLAFVNALEQRATD